MACGQAQMSPSIVAEEGAVTRERVPSQEMVVVKNTKNRKTDPDDRDASSLAFGEWDNDAATSCWSGCGGGLQMVMLVSVVVVGCRCVCVLQLSGVCTRMSSFV